ncbi:MAG: 4Fe-4S dicluster domain-containing protein [Caldilineales bacterium]|nr:4Fe-4S dicluster domain-containing protein [Caldilineales bacterium]
MQHNIEISPLGPRGDAMADAIRACVHCGFCLSACPTYAVLGEEMDSPRGRIYLMKGVLENAIKPEAAEPYLDRCLGCVACVPACPSGVSYGDLLMSYRVHAESERSRPAIDSASRRLIVETLPYPNRFRRAVQAGRISRGLRRALPDAIGAMVDMCPTSLPKSHPLPEVYPAKGKRRARVALLAGCVQMVLNPDINWATLRVLAENGVETVIPKKQGCCGAILIHVGEDRRAQEMAAKNMQVFPSDVDAIITNAAGCGSGMHEYPLLFKGLPEEEQAREFSHKVKDITVFLDELGFVTPPGLPQPMKVAYHDACHLLHAQGVRNPPRHLLSSVPNLELLELDDGGMCCGSAGTYNLVQPQIAEELGRRKVERILATGAQAVATGNIGCLTQIENHCSAQPIQIYHTIELLDIAYGNHQA